MTEAEKRAWAAATRHVRPLPGKATPRAPAASTRHQDQVSATAPKSVSSRVQHAPPENRQNERTVRRGRQQVAGRLDLHGHTQDSAWRVLPMFLRRAQAQGAKCVIVITGKGRSGEGVLRRNFLHWLEMPEAAGLVSGYAPAHPKHGGGGAWYVYLRKPSADRPK
ncbi:MAG: Smr/MutS family protein [Henriciella sp.]|nr:Smr/MutS family protein [Henriciella sp.]